VWQDVLIATANILLGYSIAYQVYLGFKRKKGFLALQTSALTTAGLYLLSFAFFTLGFYLSTLVSFFDGTLWLVLFVQRLIYKRA